ncbi:Rabl2a protein [Salpingoeca rosetta]|uniref:Rabl2a protein n=1 Tax=Salpingoeca rosetta (strain ATCC 50818 / BSB-021) TaxID=946362 RepID=F2U5X4_SALR5|nr:Rabl2a protein [Salpingoeca rosetta]EGD82915.1 Rabl2a protein [Salpingoeca rosetta]|eukprot:XP_004995279.1 Rabl2a protein [Salpingoeca rosetta]
MADDVAKLAETSGTGENTVKVICLGDSAVGKSKLVERFLMDDYKPHQLSTYALTLFKHTATVGDKEVVVDFWDTAGQERFSSMHPSYYHEAHSCILVFDITRKVTYKNLQTWYKELRKYRPKIPVICVANKIDIDYSVTQKSFGFPKKHGLPFHFVSASDGTNVVKVFNEAIESAVQYKEHSDDFVDQVMQLLHEDKFAGDDDDGDAN